MDSLTDYQSADRQVLAGTPEGQDARVLVDRAAQTSGLICHVALDDARLARLSEFVRFFAPSLRIAELPAWDCLPYDRVSPHADIVSQRLDTLTTLAQHADDGGGGPIILLTTVNALGQRVPPRTLFRDAAMECAVGQTLDQDALKRFFTANGYMRAETVREPGEFAIRGGIIDLFPPGLEEPVRLDLFGDEVEQIRLFDPINQRTTGKLDRVSLKPVAELTLDEPSIQRFRAGYREAFGAVLKEDPLYEAISEGRRYAGMEHWLPLFHERLETVFDYLGEAPISLDHHAEEAWRERLDQIQDFYRSREEMRQAAAKNGGAPYKPLPPDRLYLTADEWDERLSLRPVAELSPFAPVDADPRAGDGGGRLGRDFAPVRADPNADVYTALKEHVGELQGQGRRLLVAAYSTGARERLIGLMRDHAIEPLAPVESGPDAETLDSGTIGVAVLGLERGFVADDLAVVTEQDVLGDRLARPKRRRSRKSDAFVLEMASLNDGDLIVHNDHGIGRYDGLETITAGGAPHDCLRISYAGDDRLFVPVENIDVLSRFGSEDTPAQLDKLGGAGWQARKARVKKRLLEMADQLLQLAAARQVKQATPLSPDTGAWEEFCSRFPYHETDDQLRAIEDVLDDLNAGQPMDRLICGDVGFGKTEVALRAAFIAAMSGQQVAVIVPTTLLARQHFKSFSSRFAGLPVRLAQLSRFVKGKEATEVKKGVADGTIDIVVGTHALLSNTVKFDRLGLLIVDEEQRFGVKQKEKLKELREDVHVLTLSATPIPRTLQMSLTGVRDLSLITTPPVDRLAVRTFVMPFDAVIVREAILREHYRGGQTFYVCPRVSDIPEVEERLKELVPEVKVITAHGQMAAGELEARMAAFDDGHYDILLATNIIESGLDIARANTMIVHRADLFGLAQLYQIRGRIGRSKLRAYAYLTYRPDKVLQKSAQQRLEVIETLDSLGAGFQLASHDLDIRGAGNLLGEEQSGHIKEVGVELYQQMLEEAVESARRGDGFGESGADSVWQPQINLGMPVLIPDDYVSDLGVRLNLYRRIADLRGTDEIDGFAAEMIDRFGPLPPEVENLFRTVSIKQMCRMAGVERFDAGPKGAVIGFRNDTFSNVQGLVEFLGKQAGTAKLRPDQRLVYVRDWTDRDRRLKGAEHLMQELVALAV